MFTRHGDNRRRFGDVQDNAIYWNFVVVDLACRLRLHLLAAAPVKRRLRSVRSPLASARAVAGARGARARRRAPALGDRALDASTRGSSCRSRSSAIALRGRRRAPAPARASAGAPRARGTRRPMLAWLVARRRAGVAAALARRAPVHLPHDRARDRHGGRGAAARARAAGRRRCCGRCRAAARTAVGGCVMAARASRRLGWATRPRSRDDPARRWRSGSGTCPPLFDAAVADVALHRLQHLSFFVTALLFWWAMLRRSRPGRRRLAPVRDDDAHQHPRRADRARAARALPPADGGAPAFGLTPLEDQQLAGVIMWVPAETVYAGAALCLGRAAGSAARRRRAGGRDGRHRATRRA